MQVNMNFKADGKPNKNGRVYSQEVMIAALTEFIKRESGLVYVGLQSAQSLDVKRIFGHITHFKIELDGETTIKMNHLPKVNPELSFVTELIEQGLVEFSIDGHGGHKVDDSGKSVTVTDITLRCLYLVMAEDESDPVEYAYGKAEQMSGVPGDEKPL